MFFRGRQPEASIWRRFRANEDLFTFAGENDLYTAHVVANAERVVDLFHSFTEQFGGGVDVVLDDLRSGRSWKGEGVALAEVREAIARLKILLARYGGVEISVYTDEDQLTLDPNLELFIYARSDRWLYLLEGRGFEERSRVYSKSWKNSQRQFPAAPDLVNAVTAAADKLDLKPA